MLKSSFGSGYSGNSAKQQRCNVRSESHDEADSPIRDEQLHLLLIVSRGSSVALSRTFVLT